MQGLANICVVLSAVFWLAADFPLSAEVVSLAPVADTSLFEYSPTNNIGGAPFVTAGVTGDFAGNSKSRGLLKFDLAPALPAGARINAARLVLQVTKTNTSGTSPTYEHWQVWTNFSSSATATNFVVRDSSNTLPRFYRVKAE